VRENRQHGSEGGEGQPFPTPMCAWEQARSGRRKSSSGRCPFPVVESNCVAVKRGGEQLEANTQSVVKRTRFGRV
jgi:hypothetical protein